uniref:Uncharacterized protein n=1 Tax=Avena sativa TaxID=4498 RepID=A0ACD5W3G3_AVESA
MRQAPEGAEQLRSTMQADMAAQRAARERRIAAGRDRYASASKTCRAGLQSARSGGRQTLSRQEGLAGLKKQVLDLEAALAQALSHKHTKESKCERTRESISTSAAACEQLRNLVADQRSRRDQHATAVSRVLQAVEALEIKSSEDEQWRKDIDKAVFWYQESLGLQVIAGEGVVKFIFDKVDLQIPDKEFSFSLKVDNDRYTLTQSSQPVEDSEELLKDLNLTNDLDKFVKIIRQRLQAALVNGTPSVTTTVCPDASPLPISSPVIGSVDSRNKSGADQNHSQSKNKKQALPAKRRASALSAASPCSVRRSPRFPGNG